MLHSKLKIVCKIKYEGHVCDHICQKVSYTCVVQGTVFITIQQLARSIDHQQVHVCNTAKFKHFCSYSGSFSSLSNAHLQYILSHGLLLILILYHIEICNQSIGRPWLGPFGIVLSFKIQRNLLLCSSYHSHPPPLQRHLWY